VETENEDQKMHYWKMQKQKNITSIERLTTNRKQKSTPSESVAPLVSWCQYLTRIKGDHRRTRFDSILPQTAFVQRTEIGVMCSCYVVHISCQRIIDAIASDIDRCRH